MDKAYGPSTLGGYAQRQSDIARRLLSEMPEWHRRQLMMEAKSNARRQIDPDIASMKSMSLSAKIQLQTDRNFEEAKQNALTLSLDDIVREKWYEQFWESE
jgi:FtsZ-interacting cell division protein YlmF